MKFFRSISPFLVHDYLATNPEILIIEVDYMRR